MPPTLARWIASKGHDADHVAQILTPSEPDPDIVAYAVANGAVIVTKDSDFLTLAPPPPLLLVTAGNIPNRALTALFEARFAAVADLLAGGQSIVEIG